MPGPDERDEAAGRGRTDVQAPPQRFGRDRSPTRLPMSGVLRLGHAITVLNPYWAAIGWIDTSYPGSASADREPAHAETPGR